VSAATAIAAIAAVASAAVGTASAYQQSQAAKSQANYQSQVASNNATIAMQNAERLQQYGDRLPRTSSASASHRLKPQHRARLATGFLVTMTPALREHLLLEDLAAEGEYDILKLRDRYAQQVQAAQVQGVNFNAEASLASLKAAQPSPGIAL
jgi:hypothetical protein